MDTNGPGNGFIYVKVVVNIVFWHIGSDEHAYGHSFHAGLCFYNTLDAPA